MRIWFFGPPFEYLVYKAHRCHAFNLRMVARRLLKQTKIPKTETVAIRVGDGTTIHSPQASM